MSEENVRSLRFEAMSATIAQLRSNAMWAMLTLLIPEATLTMLNQLKSETL